MALPRKRVLLATALAAAVLIPATTAAVAGQLDAQPTAAPAPAAPALAAPALAAPALVSAPAPKAAFNHPGVVVSKAQLDLVKQKVAQRAQPWKTAFDRMRASNFASLSRTAKPRANVECGPSSNPNRGCSDEREDAMAAYTHALLWYLTGDARYARKSIEIMDAWSAVIKQHTNSNAPLQTGWAGANWSKAGELILHSNAGWPPAKANQFKTMLRTVYLPTLIKGAPNKNGNWELIMTDAAVGIAVLLDDRASFDKAVSTWRKRLAAYIYVRSDGATPKSPPNGNKSTKAALIRYWQGQSRFENGLAQETCRDFGHTGWGFAAAVHVAETARHQGLDLYAEGRQRLTAAMEFHAAYELGKAVPSWLCNGKVSKGLGPMPEMVYNHYVTRLGGSMPETKRLVDRARPTGASYFIGWETLTHAQNP